MAKYVFFDLDGTLTQSHFGILRSAEYALSKFDMTMDDPEKRRLFLGPPLTVSFHDLFGLEGDDVTKAIEYYRECYKGGAYKEAPLYDGIKELLDLLSERGLILMVVTSKPRVLAKKVVEHFDIDKYFYKVIGPDEEKKSAGKEDLIKEALEEIRKMKSEIREEDLSELAKEAVMIGDREFDIKAAKNLGLTAIGALYGYGTREELENAGADHIAEHPHDINSII